MKFGFWMLAPLDKAYIHHAKIAKLPKAVDGLSAPDDIHPMTSQFSQ